jgi:hypothetical protein
LLDFFTHNYARRAYFFYHKKIKTKDLSMSFTRTATTDGFGRSVQITNGRFVATMMTGLLPVADLRI